MEITENRLKHMLGVANKMERIVKNNLQKYSLSPEEAFVLGFLHDVGYKFSATQQEHMHKGGLVLKEMGYPFWLEVYCHGDPNPNYASQELDLLNFCDMTVGPDGQEISIAERLKDIQKKYGSESKQFYDALEVTSNLISRKEFL